MSETVRGIGAEQPAERLRAACAGIEQVIHTGLGGHLDDERVAMTYDDEMGVHRKREFGWMPIMQGEDVLKVPRFTKTDGPETTTYYWLDENTVMYFPPGQDDRPEEAGPDRQDEMAAALEWFHDSLIQYPEHRIVYGQDPEESKMAMVKQIVDLADEIETLAHSVGPAHANEETLRIHYTDANGVEHVWLAMILPKKKDDGTVEYWPAINKDDGGQIEGFQLLSPTDIHYYPPGDEVGYEGDESTMYRMMRSFDLFLVFMKKYPSRFVVMQDE